MPTQLLPKSGFAGQVTILPVLVGNPLKLKRSGTQVVGDAVGVAVGVEVGVAVGVEVGVAVGVEVGVAEGESVRGGVGLLLLLLGGLDTEGQLGVFVGFEDGFVVGVAVGLAVGFAVVVVGAEG